MTESNALAYDDLVRRFAAAIRGATLYSPSHPLVSELASLSGVHVATFPLRFDGTWTVDADTAALVANGRVLPPWAGVGPWAVVGPEGNLLAVYEPFRSGEAKPALVIPTGG